MIYCSYFNIYLEKFTQEVDEKGKSFYQFTFKVKSLLDEDLVYYLDKRYSDFDKFIQKFKKLT